MSDTRAFIDLCVPGEVSLSAIDDFVDQWHDGDDGREIAALLGMTPDEYALWVERPDTLPFIVLVRQRNLALAPTAHA